MNTSEPALGPAEFNDGRIFTTEKYFSNNVRYSLSEPPNGGPEASNVRLNNSPQSLPEGNNNSRIFTQYFSLSAGSMAQKKVCSMIKSKLSLSSKKS